MPTDPRSPPPPQAPYFDPAAGAWILSRQADVLAAFRETRLWPIGRRGEDQRAVRDDTGKLRVREDLLETISPAKVAQWEPQMEALARDAAARLPETVPSIC